MLIIIIIIIIIIKYVNLISCKIFTTSLVSMLEESLLSL